MRRFQLIDKKSSKLWQISQEDTQLTIDSGLTGAKGQTETKSFGSPDAAFENLCALIGEKLADGYEVTSIDDQIISSQPPQAITTYSSQTQTPPQSQDGRRAILRNGARGHTIILTQFGPYVMIGEGPDRLVQILGSSKEAEEHFNRIKAANEKGGCETLQIERVSSETVIPPSRLEILGFKWDKGKLDYKGGRLSIAFDGDFDSDSASDSGIPTTARALIERIEQVSPHMFEQEWPGLKVAWHLSSDENEGEPDFKGGRLMITFDGDLDSEIPSAVCDALIEHIERFAPQFVQLLCSTQSPKAKWQQALDNKSLESVESFVFDNCDSIYRQRWNSIGCLDAVIRACPNLKKLFATGELALNPVGHLKLESLHLLDYPLSNSSVSFLEALGECHFPSLKRLALWLGEVGPAEESAIVSSLFSIKAPNLRELHIGGYGILDSSSILVKLAARKMPSQWKYLRVDGECSLADLKSILDNHGESFESLETLELPVWDDDDTGEKEWVFQVGSHLLRVKDVGEDGPNEQFQPPPLPR